MKIGLVSPYDLVVPGGVNSHIHHLSESFRAFGHVKQFLNPTLYPKFKRRLKNVASPFEQQ